MRVLLDANNAEGLDSEGEYIAPDMHFPNGCHICEVDIDPKTGKIAVDRYVAVDDLCAFRRLLEAETSSCAARNATDGEIDAIARCQVVFEHAHASGAPVSAADDAFHAAIARASQNSVYATMLDAVSVLISNARRLTENVPWAVPRAIGRNQRIL